MRAYADWIWCASLVAASKCTSCCCFGEVQTKLLWSNISCLRIHIASSLDLGILRKQQRRWTRETRELRSTEKRIDQHFCFWGALLPNIWKESLSWKVEHGRSGTYAFPFGWNLLSETDEVSWSSEARSPIGLQDPRHRRWHADEHCGSGPTFERLREGHSLSTPPMNRFRSTGFRMSRVPRWLTQIGPILYKGIIGSYIHTVLRCFAIFLWVPITGCSDTRGESMTSRSVWFVVSQNRAWRSASRFGWSHQSLPSCHQWSSFGGRNLSSAMGTSPFWCLRKRHQQRLDRLSTANEFLHHHPKSRLS